MTPASHHPAEAPPPPPLGIPGMLVVYGALMALLVATVIAAEFRLGPVSLVIALIIAFAKAILVVLYFMHVRFESRVVWIFAGISLLWLGIMLSLTFSDYLTRGWLPRAEAIGESRSAIPPPPGMPKAQPEGHKPIDFEQVPRR